MMDAVLAAEPADTNPKTVGNGHDVGRDQMAMHKGIRERIAGFARAVSTGLGSRCGRVKPGCV